MILVLFAVGDEDEQRTLDQLPWVRRPRSWTPETGVGPRRSAGVADRDRVGRNAEAHTEIGDRLGDLCARTRRQRRRPLRANPRRPERRRRAVCRQRIRCVRRLRRSAGPRPNLRHGGSARPSRRGRCGARQRWVGRISKRHVATPNIRGRRDGVGTAPACATDGRQRDQANPHRRTGTIGPHPVGVPPPRPGVTAPDRLRRRDAVDPLPQLSVSFDRSSADDDRSDLDSERSFADDLRALIAASY